MGNGSPGRNDACWCGSGIKYKKCHLGRSGQSELPFEAVRAQSAKFWKSKMCLHPDASKDTCGKVIAAHTLQRSRVLQEIADPTNHVLSFYSGKRDAQGKLIESKVGINNASTFNAFCNNHDDKLFSKLEKTDFIGSKEQIFLSAYRAICWEVYQKTGAMVSQDYHKANLDRGKSIEVQRELQHQLHVQGEGLKKGYAEVLRVKGMMDNAIRQSDYSDYSTMEMRLIGEMCVAATGSVTPNITPSGHHLQTLHNPYNKTEWLSFGCDVGADFNSVFFMWRKGDKCTQRYMDELDSMADGKIPNYLVQFMFLHCENSYFSIPWWQSLSASDKDKIKSLARNYDPYYNIIPYDSSSKLCRKKIVTKYFK